LKASAINEDMGDYAATAGQPADVVTILKDSRRLRANRRNQAPGDDTFPGLVILSPKGEKDVEERLLPGLDGK
jgi:hypothetical protein